MTIVIGKFVKCSQSYASCKKNLHLIFIAGIVFTAPSLAQKLVDPNSVAPEFRDAAEKRRAEQIRVVECNRRANEAKVLPRDRTAYLNHCLEAAGEK